MELSAEENKDKKKFSQRNIGLELLRTFLCFKVVLLHYYTGNNKTIKNIQNNHIQIPCFFFMSFYFLYPIVLKRNIIKMKLRLERLLIPYIIYPISFWLINNLIFFIFKFNRFNKYLTLKELEIHLIVGKGIHGIGVLWFQFNLLIYTFIFFIISFILKKFYLVFFQIITLISYLIQYSGLNYNFFSQYSKKIWMPVGNLVETLPLAIVAFSLASINYFEKGSKNDRRKNIIFYTFYLYLIRNYNIFSYLNGYASPGIKPLINSFFLFFVFSNISLKDINPKIIFLIKQITRYTQGIYCLHIIIQIYMKKYLDKNGSFLGSILLYIFSYFTSFIGFNIFGKTKLRLLFN